MLTPSKLKGLFDTLTTKDKYKVIICDDEIDENILLSYTSLLNAAHGYDNRVLIVLNSKEDVVIISDMIIKYANLCNIEIKRIVRHSKSRTEILLSNNSYIDIRYLTVDNMLQVKGLCIDNIYAKAPIEENVLNDIAAATLYNLNSTMSIYTTPNMYVDNTLIANYKKIIIE